MLDKLNEVQLRIYHVVEATSYLSDARNLHHLPQIESGFWKMFRAECGKLRLVFLGVGITMHGHSGFPSPLCLVRISGEGFHNRAGRASSDARGHESGATKSRCQPDAAAVYAEFKL